MTNFKYFTLAPHGIDESTQQYKFEGGIEASGSPSAVNLEYRFVYDSENEDNGASEWRPYSVGDTISNTTDRWFGVQFRNDSGSFSSSGSNYYRIKSPYAFDAGGRIMSLLNYIDEHATLPDYAFCNLFSSTKIHDAHELILTDNASMYCYYYTFSYCTSLTAAPTLTPTVVGWYCYNRMFQNCTSLTTAPEIHATTLGWYCCEYMFYNCTSLTTPPSVLPATTLQHRCYGDMFNNCTSLTTAPELPATTLADYCYIGMFNSCTSLTTPPSVLPATKMAVGCYEGMFVGCKSLTTVLLELPSTDLANNCYKNMFAGCTSLTTAQASLPATTLVANCYYQMFDGCSSLTTAPVLLATTLATNCYTYMFNNCPKIDHIIWKSTTIPSSTYCSNWLSGTSASGKFEYTDPTLDVASITRDSSGVPAGWSISLLSPETKLLLKINNASVNNISLLGKKIASLSINGKNVKSSSAA